MLDDLVAEAYKRKTEEVRASHPEIVGLALIHRLGHVPLTEASVAIAVSSPHRPAAFAACRQALEILKARVPVWKKETYADETPARWVANHECCGGGHA